MIAGVALAGVTGAGKSTIFDLLAASFAQRKDYSVCILRNRLMQNSGLMSLNSGSDRRAVFNYLHDRILAIKALSDLAREPSRDSERSRLAILCESWGLNLLAELNLWLGKDFKTLDAIRAEAQIAIIHLKIMPDEILERSVLSTKKFRGTGWTNYLTTLGSDPGTQAKVFEERQDMISRYFEICQSPKLEVCTSRMAWPEYVTQIAAYFEDQ